MNSMVPYLAKLLLPKLIWEVKTEKKEIFLTFDDGPHPEITVKVMDILEQFSAKATFFCVGENMDKYRLTYDEILSRGHQTGNHTYNHLNGWKTSNQHYFQNIKKCAATIDSGLFRPPYGRIRLSQIKPLKQDFIIVMWSVLSRDFDRRVSPEQCLKNTITNSKPGSIVVFHDSEKSSMNMFYALPRFLDHFSKQGYTFPVLTKKLLM